MRAGDIVCYVCQLGNGYMLKRLHNGRYTRKYTGYPYPDTELRNIDAIRSVFGMEAGTDEWNDVDNNLKKYINKINALFDKSGTTEICLGKAGSCLSKTRLKRITDDFSSLFRFEYDKERNVVTYTGYRFTGNLVGDLERVQCGFKNSFLHKSAFAGLNEGYLEYDISRICGNTLFCGAFVDYFSGNKGRNGVSLEKFRAGFNEFKCSEFNVSIARLLLMKKDLGSYSVVSDFEDTISYVFYSLNIQPIVVFLMSGRGGATGLFGTHFKMYWRGKKYEDRDDIVGELNEQGDNNIVLSLSDICVKFEPFDLFYAVPELVYGVDIDAFLRRYELDWVKIAYYAVQDYYTYGLFGYEYPFVLGWSGIQFGVDLIVNTWQVNYIIDDVHTKVEVLFNRR